MSGFLKKWYKEMWRCKKYKNSVNCKQKKYKKMIHTSCNSRLQVQTWNNTLTLLWFLHWPSGEFHSLHWITASQFVKLRFNRTLCASDIKCISVLVWRNINRGCSDPGYVSMFCLKWLQSSLRSRANSGADALSEDIIKRSYKHRHGKSVRREWNKVLRARWTSSVEEVAVYLYLC